MIKITNIYQITQLTILVNSINNNNIIVQIHPHNFHYINLNRMLI